jgi:cell division protein FtsI (penicillin-binding protein 3)
MRSRAKERRGPMRGALPVWRLHALILLILGGFGAIAWQLTELGRDRSAGTRLMVAGAPVQHAISRPDVVDRNGQLLATDIKVYWLFADPGLILSADETVEKLAKVLPPADLVGLRARLSNKSRFEWVKRGLTPNEAKTIHDLGLPGLTLIEEPQRVYPAGQTAAHVLGHTNVDNVGLAGIEKYLDGATAANRLSPANETGRKHVRLSVDLRLQHALHDELVAARTRYDAAALGGLVLDIRSGEVLAMAGLPDYDPNRREQALIEGRHNRFYYDAYELGSVFKIFALALVFEHDMYKLTDRIDVLTPLRMGRYTLNDRHAKTQYMTVEEVFTHSSNTGAARLALAAGGEKQRALFEKLGLMEAVATELGQTARPLFPDPWREVNTMTAAYGHGFSVPPFAFAIASAALLNGGFKVAPSFFPRNPEENGLGERVISAATSEKMRRLFWENVLVGTGKLANVPGYRVGGKTGTAWKPAGGGYSEDKIITSFVGAFPMDDPRYLTLIVIDEPKPEKKGERTEAGHNAAPTTGALIRRIAPMLGIAPPRRFDEPRQPSY